MIYLSLKGKARRFVLSHLIIDRDPEQIMLKLREQYGKPDKLIVHQMNVILKMKAPRLFPNGLMDLALEVSALLTSKCSLINGRISNSIMNREI